MRQALPRAEPQKPPDPREVAKAQKLVQTGLRLYRRGHYGRAQAKLKEALVIYPFLPKANLALGKILLIRGSAKRDRALMNSAKLMFEMAAALDPEAREARTLLELFGRDAEQP